MKRITINTFMIAALGCTFIMTSCKKDKKPAVTTSGTYTGSFTGLFGTHDTVNASTYQVTLTSITDDKAKVSGNDFDDFEVTLSGDKETISVVTTDISLTTFVYDAELKELKFTYNKGGNQAAFTGKK